MKKILIPLFILIIISCKAQELPYNLARELYEEHNTNILIGRRAIENSENDAVRASYALSMMLMASGLGYPVDSIDVWKEKLDGLFGETASSLSITWDAVLVRERDLDTIYVDSISYDNGSTWYDATDVANMLAAYDTLPYYKLKSDSVNNDGYATIYDVSLKAAQTEVDTLVGDNVFTNALALKANLASPTFTGTITIGSAGIDETELEILDGATLSTTELNYVDNVTSAIQTQLNAKAPQTAVDTVVGDVEFANGIAGVPDGSQYAIQLSNGDGTMTNDGDFTIQGDSARLKNMVISTSIRLAQFAGTDTFGIYGLPNGQIDSLKYSRTAGWMLENEPEPFDLFFNTRIKGELNWPRIFGDSYHNINPVTEKVQFMAAHERTWVYMDKMYRRIGELEKKNKEQENDIKELKRQLGITQELVFQLIDKIK